MNPQKTVANAVASRGYRDGYTAEQFVAKQFAKLNEEIGEAGCHVLKRGQRATGIDIFFHELFKLSRIARRVFDDDAKWTEFDLDDRRDELADEVYDIQVVLFSLSDALGIDCVQGAVNKAL